MAQLAPRWTCAAPNQFGYGRSPSWPAATAADPQAEAGLVETVLDGLGEPAHLVAHSMGAWIGLLAARVQPKRLRSMVLVEPVALGLLRAPDEIANQGAVFAMVDDVLDAFARDDIAGAIARFTDYWYGPGAWAKVPPPQRMPIFAKAGKMHCDVLAVAADRAPPAHYTGLGIPARIVVGARTTPAVRRMAEMLAGALPADRIVEMPDAGHLLPATHAPEFAALLEDFWRR